MTTKKSTPLGRGLGALLDATDLPDVNQGQIFYCDIDLLHPNPFQPRKAIDDNDLEDLRQSIQNRGVLQPIIVRPVDGRYQILAGERRWRAAKKAGLKKVPVIAREADEKEQLFIALIENLQRRDLNCIEEARAYKTLVEEFGLTQQEIASQVGKKRSTITNLLRLLSLPEDVLKHLRDDRISIGHAKALLALKNEEEILEFTMKTIENALSVRDLEKLVQSKTRPGRKKAVTMRVFREEEKVVRRALRADIKIKKRGIKGKVVMEFPSENEMKALVKLIADYHEQENQ